MNISDEKTFIYSMMRDITEERRELTKIYYDLKSRLDELNRLEIRGLADTPIKGIVDLHNEKDALRVISNIKREAEHSIKKIEQEAELKINPPEKTVIPKAEIEIEKEKVNKKTGRNSRISLDEYAGVIAHILKESEVPIAIKDLFDAVNERLNGAVTRNNFNNNILPRSMKKNKNISKASRGYYQYLNK